LKSAFLLQKIFNERTLQHLATHRLQRFHDLGLVRTFKIFGAQKLATIGLFGVILISWGLAFFEYCLQVPANRLGFKEHGGPFSLLELKVIQEVITLIVFIIFSLVMFKNETFRMNHLIGMFFLVLAVYFIFKK
jgi:uncharacterized protein (DUF486 family)